MLLPRQLRALRRRELKYRCKRTIGDMLQRARELLAYASLCALLAIFCLSAAHVTFYAACVPALAAALLPVDVLLEHAARTLLSDSERTLRGIAAEIDRCRIQMGLEDELGVPRDVAAELLEFVPEFSRRRSYEPALGEQTRSSSEFVERRLK